MNTQKNLPIEIEVEDLDKNTMFPLSGANLSAADEELSRAIRRFASLAEKRVEQDKLAWLPTKLPQYMSAEDEEIIDIAKQELKLGGYRVLPKIVSSKEFDLEYSIIKSQKRFNRRKTTRLKDRVTNYCKQIISKYHGLTNTNYKYSSTSIYLTDTVTWKQTAVGLGIAATIGTGVYKIMQTYYNKDNSIKNQNSEISQTIKQPIIDKKNTAITPNLEYITINTNVFYQSDILIKLSKSPKVFIPEYLEMPKNIITKNNNKKYQISYTPEIKTPQYKSNKPKPQEHKKQHIIESSVIVTYEPENKK